MKIKYRTMILLIACIALAMSACSHAESTDPAPSVTAETAAEEHIGVDLETPDYDSDYLIKSEIPYPVTLDCRDTGKRLLFLTMEMSTDDLSIRAEDENWLLVSDDTSEGNHLQTYAYRGCPSGGEQIIFTPIIGTTESGFSEEIFSDIQARVYSRSVSWLDTEMQEMAEDGEVLDLEPDESGGVSDEVLTMVYEIVRNEI